MHSLALILGIVCVLAWLYLLVGHGQFWMVQRLRAENPGTAMASSGPIAVVIPARNEAGVIGIAVSSLLQQTWAGSLHIFVVDDNSSDDTSDVARQAAMSSSRPEALTVIAGKPLPAGWSGKLWAMQQGIEQALAVRPDYLLLTDADVQHSPDNVLTLVAWRSAVVMISLRSWSSCTAAAWPRSCSFRHSCFSSSCCIRRNGSAIRGARRLELPEAAC